MSPAAIEGEATEGERQERPRRRAEPVDLAGEAGEQQEPPRGADRRGEQRGAGDAQDRRPRSAHDQPGEERDGRERERDLLDQEGDRERGTRSQAETEAAAPDGQQPDPDVEQGERRGRDVEPGRPGQIVEVRHREVARGRQAADGRSHPPAERPGEHEQAGIRRAR